MGLSAELLGGALVTLIGIGLTTGGEFAHVPQAVAPGALCVFVGGGWLGASLARRDVRLLPGTVHVERTPDHEALRV